MLRNVMFVAMSGLVLFSMELANAVSQSRLIGSLISAMVEFSTQTTGMPVQYIELTNVAVTIVSNDVAKVFCALLCDREDGYDFGKLIATQTLLAFISQYSTDLGKVGPNLRDFRGFEKSIAEILRNSVKPVLFRLQEEYPGVVQCMLMTAGSHVYSTDDVDQLAAISSLQALLLRTEEIMDFAGDNAGSLVIDRRDTKILVRKLPHATLVVVLRKDFNVRSCSDAIERNVGLLHKVMATSMTMPSVRCTT